MKLFKTIDDVIAANGLHCILTVSIGSRTYEYRVLAVNAYQFQTIIANLTCRVLTRKFMWKGEELSNRKVNLEMGRWDILQLELDEIDQAKAVELGYTNDEG